MTAQPVLRKPNSPGARISLPGQAASVFENREPRQPVSARKESGDWQTRQFAILTGNRSPGGASLRVPSEVCILAIGQDLGSLLRWKTHLRLCVDVNLDYRG